jgi:hypothetical protein
MATREVVIKSDDLDGTESTDPSAIVTIPFAYEGVAYEIDLTDKNAQKLYAVFGRYTKSARRVGGRRLPSKSRGASRPVKQVTVIEASPDAIRAWARSNGIQVSSRGRVSGEVREAFKAANR